MAGGDVSKLGAGVTQSAVSDIGDDDDDDDDESVSRVGQKLRLPPPAAASKRSRPKQLTVTSTTALLSPGPTANKNKVRRKSQKSLAEPGLCISQSLVAVCLSCNA